MDWASLGLPITAGLLLVFAGRKFFWLASGMTAFLLAFGIFQKYFGQGWTGLILALLLGTMCAWLAVLLVRSVGYLVGAVAGAAGLPILLGMLGIQSNWWLLALVGLLAGILLVKLAYNWGLILMTVWVGSYATSSQVSAWLALNSRLATLVFVLLLGAGILVQAWQLRRKY